MKRLSTLLAFASLLSPLSALPLGNPAEPTLFLHSACLNNEYWDDVNFRLGYYGDFVYDRHFEVDRSQNFDDLDRTRVTTNAAYFAINLFQRADAFFTLGASSLSIEGTNSAFLATNFVSTGTASGQCIVSAGSDFSWSIGARGVVFDRCNTILGVEGQYFQTSPHVTLVNRPGGDGVGITVDYVNPGSSVDITYREWQLGFSAAYQIECGNVLAVPYLGLKIAQARSQAGNAVIVFPATSGPSSTLTNMRSNKYIGYGTGLTLVFANSFDVTVEGRFADEKALYVNGQMRF